VPSGVDPVAERRPRDRGRPMPELLQVLPASPWLRTAAGVVIAVGCVMVAASVVASLHPSAIRQER
jgi:nitric oxide reductase large subunit